MKYRVIYGQVHVWDDTPEWEFGQCWIPICVRCGSGPLIMNGIDSVNGLLCVDCDDDLVKESDEM